MKMCLFNKNFIFRNNISLSQSKEGEYEAQHLAMQPRKLQALSAPALFNARILLDISLTVDDP
jgi:hypothetical protein